ncbi:hypothetical protein V6E05_01060 [Citrobacter freundii]
MIITLAAASIKIIARGNAKRKAAPKGAAFKGAQAMYRNQKGGVLPPP